MKYVVLRDDDANGTTPVSLLEPLYRPFLDRGFPVHLAMIPCVRTDIHRLDGGLEGFLCGREAGRAHLRPIEENPALLDYVQHERGYVPVMHGFTHEFIDGHYEFGLDKPIETAQRLDRGLTMFEAAGLGRPSAFVAPQDQLSRSSLYEVTKRFGVLSTQFLGFKNLPPRYWPAHLVSKKLHSRRHLRLGRAIALTHPGCILSYNKSPNGMLERVLQAIRPHDVTVVVTHHWEYFRADGSMNEPFVAVLHALAAYLAEAHDVRVVRIEDAHRYIG
jgi:hypothetical protein